MITKQNRQILPQLPLLSQNPPHLLHPDSTILNDGEPVESNRYRFAMNVFNKV